MLRLWHSKPSVILRIALVWVLAGFCEHAYAIEPVTTIAIIGLIMSAAAGGYSAHTQQQASKFQAKLADQNQDIAKQEAQDSLARGAEEKRKHQLKVAQLISVQEASLAAAGAEIGSGTATDLVADTAMLGEIDSQIIENNAEREAYSNRLRGVGFAADASAYAFESKVGPASTLLNTGASLIGSASKYDWSDKKETT